MPNARQTTPNFRGDNLSINMFGAVPDLKFGSDGSVAASTAFTTTTTVFSPNDVDSFIWIENLAGGSDFLTTIAAFVDIHTITLAAAPSFTVSAKNFRYGTDNAAAIQAAFDHGTSKGVRVLVPRGAYGVLSSLTPHNCLYIRGNGFTENNNPATAGTQIVCCADIPIINYTDAVNQLEAFQCEKITFVGTSRSGSKGIYLNATYGTVIRDTSFNYFGDQGLQIIQGQAGNIDNIQAQMCVLVTTGRSDYVGAVEIGPSDIFCRAIESTTNISFNPMPYQTGKYGNGWCCGIVIRGGAATYVQCIGHGSQNGIVITGANASLTTLIACRGDLNQGSGFVVDGAFSITLINPWANTNSLDTDGAYDGIVIKTGGCTIIHSKVTAQGGSAPLNNKVRNGINIDVPGGQENCYITAPYSAAAYIANLDIAVTGSQTAIISDQQGPLTPGAEAVHRTRYAAIAHVDPTAPTDSGVFSQKLINVGGGHEQLVLSLFNDLYQEVTRWLVADRSGTTLNSVTFENAAFMQILMELLVNLGIILNDPGEATDAKRWAYRSNTGNEQLILTAQNDAASVENIWARVQRSGAAISWIQFAAPYVELLAQLKLGNTYTILFEGNGSTISAGSGDPNTVVTANRGSLYLDNTGAFWFKSTGSGNIGWLEIYSGSIPIPVPVDQGGTGRTTLMADGVVIGNGTSGVLTVGPPADHEFLKGVSGAWVSQKIQYNDLPTPNMTSSVTVLTSISVSSSGTTDVDITGIGYTTVTMNFTNGLWTS